MAVLRSPARVSNLVERSVSLLAAVLYPYRIVWSAFGTSENQQAVRNDIVLFFKNQSKINTLGVGVVTP